MRTFKDIKKGQYIYRVKLSDYSIKKVPVYSNQNADIVCGKQFWVKLESVCDKSYFIGDIFGYATCKQALKELLAEHSKLNLNI